MKTNEPLDIQIISQLDEWFGCLDWTYEKPYEILYWWQDGGMSYPT